MSAKTRVLQILTGVEAARIRFTCPFGSSTATVNQAAFNQVAAAVKADKIQVQVSTTFPPGVGAQYFTNTNTIQTPPLIGRADEGLVLHECTHAFFDISKSAIDALSDEAAAYVVDALYFRMTNLARTRWNAQLHAAAGQVADSLLSEYGKGTTPLPAVDTTAWNNLTGLIKTNPVYSSGPAGTGGNYLHDGV